MLAIGGNSLIAEGMPVTVKSQLQACEVTCQHIADIIQDGYQVVVTHGNGPQVGFILRRAELAKHELHMVPLDSCVADTQGAIGYHIQLGMQKAMRDWAKKPPVATVVTQVLVDVNDPSFASPSKPIGSFMGEDEARLHQERDGWNVVEDSGRGFRRVVASPLPMEIIEVDSIRTLLEAGALVIAAGGGGIPVVYNEEGILVGSEAVIDKDRASSLLARNLGADTFVISTAVDKVHLNHGKPDQVALEHISLAQAKEYLAQGHFAPGSMKPKIESVIEFLEDGGKVAYITTPDNLSAALRGEAGTKITA